MSKDHYIAQTYMKHFIDAENNNNLHVYDKQTSNYFTPSTKNICSSEGWDTNPYFKNDRAVEIFLNAVEPQWDACVENIFNLKNNKIIKFYLSGYIAVLASCTPASVRIGTNWQTDVTHQFAMNIISDMQNNPENYPDMPPTPPEILELLKKPNGIKTVVDPKHPHAMAISILPDVQWNFYKADWLILINETENFF